MSSVLTSIIIPTYNHAAFLPLAVRSALEQTAAVEVVVVDDGSTDDTEAIARTLVETNPRVLYFKRPHLGVSEARNFGLAAATGDYIMFLDADDVLTPSKVAMQLAALEGRPDCGWCLCDTFIQEVNGSQSEAASQRYDYASKNLGGWIFPHLSQQNFIPIMAPLVRADVLSEGEVIRFDDRLVPEDWFFWMEVAKRSRVCYVPQVGGLYVKRRDGRNSQRRPSRVILPPVQPPLRLNLGCGTPGTASWHPMPGLLNLDRSLGWRFQDGLRDFEDGSVAGITISHALMYLPEAQWKPFFLECYRVLRPGGVIRITEDDTQHPFSTRRGGWKGSEPAIAMTAPDLLADVLFFCGFDPYKVGPDETKFEDTSLVQHQHGDIPDVFFVEGVKR